MSKKMFAMVRRVGRASSSRRQTHKPHQHKAVVCRSSTNPQEQRKTAGGAGVAYTARHCAWSGHKKAPSAQSCGAIVQGLWGGTACLRSGRGFVVTRP